MNSRTGAPTSYAVPEHVLLRQDQYWSLMTLNPKLGPWRAPPEGPWAASEQVPCKPRSTRCTKESLSRATEASCEEKESKRTMRSARGRRGRSIRTYVRLLLLAWKRS